VWLWKGMAGDDAVRGAPAPPRQQPEIEFINITFFVVIRLVSAISAFAYVNWLLGSGPARRAAGSEGPADAEMACLPAGRERPRGQPGVLHPARRGGAVLVRGRQRPAGAPRSQTPLLPLLPWSCWLFDQLPGYAERPRPFQHVM